MDLPEQGVRNEHRMAISYVPYQGMSFPQYLATLKNLDDFGRGQLAKLFAMDQGLSGAMESQRAKWKRRLERRLQDASLARAVCRAAYIAVEDMPKGRLLSL
jgi:hypothetical protein